MAVDAATVQWLKDGAMFVIAADAGVATAWGTDGLETDIVSPIAVAADAATEADRQQQFLEGPLVEEAHDVPGRRSDLLGRPVTLTCDRLGYDAGVAVFVIGVDEAARPGRTILTVLRRLT